MEVSNETEKIKKKVCLCPNSSMAKVLGQVVTRKDFLAKAELARKD